MWRNSLLRLMWRGMMLTVMMVVVSGRGVGLLGSLPGLLTDVVLRRWGGIIGLVLLTLTHLWENNIGLATLRDIRIGKEDHLLFIL
jgi:hypothetical protein